MKISKLFHWLYAFLMFLPVMALAPSLFYFAFNQQSQNYTDVQVNETYEYETNEVNSASDLVIGNIYKYDINAQNYPTGAYVRTRNLFINDGVFYTYRSNEDDLIFYLSETNIAIFISNNGDWISAGTFPKTYLQTPYTFYFTYDANNSIYDTSVGNIAYVGASDYLGEKTVDVVRSEQSPMNIFYTAVNYVYDMPVFSWAKNSFLALPITYITGLFGMASNNVVNYYLSYWLAISIVYLVFDLVMYVPMLVHRWIDKGMIE